jgi:hypothetical protein
MLTKKLSKIFDDDNSRHHESHFKILEIFRGESTDDKRISETIIWAKEQGYLAKLDISEDSAASLLNNMLIDHNLPDELRNNAQLRSELEQVAKDKAGESSPLSDEEAKRVFKLIKSGEIFSDLFYTFNVLFSLIIRPDHFSNLDNSFKAYISALTELPKSIISDLDSNTAFKNISSQIKLAKEGKPLNNPEILNNTLQTIYSAPEVGNTIDVISALIAPENESLRIALLVYARLNGVSLEQQDIDKVRNSILNRDEPNFGSLILYILTPENSIRLAGR